MSTLRFVYFISPSRYSSSLASQCETGCTVDNSSPLMRLREKGEPLVLVDFSETREEAVGRNSAFNHRRLGGWRWGEVEQAKMLEYLVKCFNVVQQPVLSIPQPVVQS